MLLLLELRMSLFMYDDEGRFNDIDEAGERNL